jgi:ribosomal protein S18 acetylase RimI-like enzyme
MWVFEGDARWLGLLAARGFRPAACGMTLLGRDLSALPPVPSSMLPPGFSLGALAGPHQADARALASYLAFHQGRAPSESERRIRADRWRRLMAAPGYERDMDVVAVAPDGQVAAFALGWLDTHNRVGEFEPVGTVPAYQRLGLGGAVIEEGLHRMRERGMAQAIVYVEWDNAPAQRLYASLGFQPLCRILTCERPLA